MNTLRFDLYPDLTLLSLYRWKACARVGSMARWPVRLCSSSPAWAWWRWATPSPPPPSLRSRCTATSSCSAPHSTWSLSSWTRGQAVYLDVKLFKLYRTVLLIAVGVADPHTVHSNADPDPGSALAFMRFRIQMQIRIQKGKIRLEKLKGKQKNVHGKYLNFQFKFSAFFASGFGSIKSPVILILVTDYYSAADPHHGLL